MNCLIECAHAKKSHQNKPLRRPRLSSVPIFALPLSALTMQLHYLGDMVGRPVCNTTTKSGRSSTTRLRSTADISLPSSLAQPLDSTSKDTRRHPYKMHRDSRINPLEATPTGSPTPPPKRPGVLPPIEKQSRRPSAMPLLRSNP